ncbi:hypothetical protein INT47_007306 [Mucor saturninus]|uniref:Uncharacterized protein n=1 Tax=Mucor saturninus TaxID=64648 RepID=A0A8H7R9L8_9FUNG|nr:hypothetical protein INT47_007306 [Mucor saturninus]
MHLSTDEKRVSLTSITSSLAFQSGIPKDGIVTMGNWASSTRFETIIAENISPNFDFTNTLITSDNNIEDDEHMDNIFFDAMDDNMDFTLYVFLD